MKGENQHIEPSLRSSEWSVSRARTQGNRDFSLSRRCVRKAVDRIPALPFDFLALRLRNDPELVLTLPSAANFTQGLNGVWWVSAQALS